MLDMADIITQNFIRLCIYKQHRTNSILEKSVFVHNLFTLKLRGSFGLTAKWNSPPSYKHKPASLTVHPVADSHHFWLTI